MKLKSKMIAAVLALTTVTSVSFSAAPLAYSAGTAAAVSAQKLVSLNCTAIVMGEGEVKTLQPSVLNSQDSVSKWVTTDPSVVYVKNGVLKARGTGEATIKVRTAMGGLDTCTVKVKAAPAWVKLPVSSVCIGTGENYQLRASIPDGSVSSTMKYTVDNPRIVTCNKMTGSVTGRKRGSTTMTVKTHNGMTASCSIKVLNEPTSVSLNASKLTLGVGETFALQAVLPELTASNMKVFRSDNSKVVSCDANGRITAIAPGTANVSVRLYNGLKATCTVTVYKAPQSFRLSTSSLRLNKGTTCTLYCMMDSGYAAHSRSFSSSNTKVATVSSNGTVTAVAPGTATVTATLYNGVKASCTVTVSEPAPPVQPEITAKNYLDLQNDLAVLAYGETFTIRPANSNEGTLTYITADKNVATVGTNGVIKAVGTGTTDITVRSSSGKASKVAVIVTGDRYSTTFPTASETDELLNKEKLGAPMKTNCPDLDKLVDSIMAKIIKPGMTNAQKVRACYEYLALNSTYGRPIGVPELTHYYKYSSDVFIINEGYSILKNHSGTCENFACALTILMRRLGYKADVVEGLTGLRAGGKGGHFWTDVTLGDKHYSFDAQIENNNLYGNQVLYYWYGTKPELNFKTCEYQYLHRVHDFATAD